MLRAVSAVPVIVATARDDDDSVVQALDAGADDYVLKPFRPASWRPASARCCAGPPARRRRGRAGHRRRPDRRPAQPPGDPRRASRSSCPPRSSTCSPTWPRAPGTVVSKRELLTEVWQLPYGGVGQDRRRPPVVAAPQARRVAPPRRGCCRPSAAWASGWPSPSREAPDHAAGGGDDLDRAAGLPAAGRLPGGAGRRGARAGHRAGAAAVPHPRRSGSTAGTQVAANLIGTSATCAPSRALDRRHLARRPGATGDAGCRPAPTDRAPTPAPACCSRSSGPTATARRRGVRPGRDAAGGRDPHLAGARPGSGSSCSSSRSSSPTGWPAR